MMKKIKEFFRSLMFWKKKTKPIHIDTINRIKPVAPAKNPEVISDDGIGGEIKKPKPILETNEIPLHYRIAFKEVGIKEIRGKRHNPRVLEYHDTTGDFSDDETPWCASFINWVIIEQYWNKEKKCYIYMGSTYKRTPTEMQKLAKLVATGKANARSFLNIGKEVEPKDARRGDIVIFYRGRREGWQGHVGLVAGLTGDKVKSLGGNQSNAVNIKSYPKRRVLGYRRI